MSAPAKLMTADEICKTIWLAASAGTSARRADHAAKAVSQVRLILAMQKQYHAMLGQVEEAGITLLSTNPEEPLSLPSGEAAND